MILRRLLEAVSDDTDGAGVVEFLECLDEFPNVIAALAERLDELVPAHGLGVAGLGAGNLDEEELGKGLFQKRREVLHALDLQLMAEGKGDADIVVGHKVRDAQGLLERLDVIIDVRVDGDAQAERFRHGIQAPEFADRIGPDCGITVNSKLKKDQTTTSTIFSSN